MTALATLDFDPTRCDADLAAAALLAGPPIPLFAPPAASQSTAQIVDAIDAAVDEHLQWLQAWHRALICREAMPIEMASPNAAFLCRFGAWYEVHRHDGGLLDQPAFHDLAEAHERMHDQSRMLARVIQGGGVVPVAEYDALVAAVSDFNLRARRISAAFQRLKSDLDPLTGAHSRQAMLVELEREAARTRRTAAPLCVALLDLDHFKRINDSLGHAAGDHVLITAAGRLLAHVRPYDTVFRYGGEEFLLCLPNADLGAATAVCERLRLAVAEAPVEIDDADPVSVTASIGVASLGAGPIKDAIEAADRALYAAKRGGRDRVVAATA
ncbi:MAG: diguanylate cyclase [Alphaproteobacteria bacterium]|nr:diguanylate cyclase [Alphaproteobacteria bacterium]